MVATVGSIQVLFNVEYGAAVQSLRRFSSESEKTGQRVTRAVQGIDKAATATHRSLARLDGNQFRTLSLSALRASNSVERLRGVLLATSGLIGGLSLAIAVKGLQEYSDQYRNLNNQMRASISDGEDLADTQEAIFRSAQRSRSEYAATAKLFSRINVSAQRLNIAQSESLRVTETIQKAFTLGGSTPTEAAQSSLQLSQGIASNRLGGDELKSVLENQALGQLLANRITDGDIGRLRALSEAGELTAGVVIRAFRDAGTEIDRLFLQSEETVAGAFQKIDNALLRFVGTNDGVQSSMSATIVLLNAIADNIDTLATSITYLGAAAAGIFGVKGVNQLRAYVSGVASMRAEAIKTTGKLKEQADAAAAAAGERLRGAQLGVMNAGNIADSTAGRKFADINAAEAKRIALLKEEREAAKAAAGEELNRALAIKNGTQAGLVRAQQTAANKGFIADSEANKAANAQLQTDLARLVALKQERDLIVGNARAAMDAAKEDRDAIEARAKILEGDRTAEHLVGPGGASILGNVRKELDKANSKLAKSEGAYNEALKLTAQTENELYQITERADHTARVQVIENQSEAQKGLSAAYRDHASASRAAADAEAKYSASIRELNDVQAIQRQAESRVQKDTTVLRGGVQAQARKAHAEALKEYSIATQRADAETKKFNQTLADTTLRAVAARSAMRGLQSVSDFFGGPIGLGLIALAGVMTWISMQSQEAEDAIASYSAAIKAAGEESKNSSEKLMLAGRAIEEVRKLASQGPSLERNAAAQQEADKLEAISLQMYRATLWTELSNVFSGIDTKRAIAEVYELVDAFGKGETSLEELEKAFQDISGKAPDLSTALAAILELARGAMVARGAIDALQGGIAAPKGARPGSEAALMDRVEELRKTPLPVDVRDKLTEQLRDTSLERMNETPSNKLDEMMARLYGITGAKASTGGKKDDPFADAMKSSQEGIAALNAEAQALSQVKAGANDYEKGLTAAKEAQELLTAAQKGGQPVGKELHDVQQLLYGDLTKLTPAAQAQALAIRQMAIATGEAQAKVNMLNEANQKAAEDLEWQKDIMKGALSTLRTSLVEGKSLWQALGDVALSVLDKIADRIETNLVDSLFSANGGGFNFLSLLFNTGSTFNPTGKSPGLYASGTHHARSGLAIVGEAGPELLNLRGGEKITPNHLLSDEVDNIASSQAGFRSASATAVENTSRFRGNTQINGDFRVYVDQDGNWKAEVAKISYGTSAQVMQAGGEHIMGTEVPQAVARQQNRPRRRKVKAS